MCGDDLWITLKVGRVERQQVTDAVREHRGHQACIVHLHTLYLTDDDYLTPVLPN